MAMMIDRETLERYRRVNATEHLLPPNTDNSISILEPNAHYYFHAGGLYHVHARTSFFVVPIHHPHYYYYPPPSILPPPIHDLCQCENCVTSDDPSWVHRSSKHNNTTCKDAATQTDQSIIMRDAAIQTEEDESWVFPRTEECFCVTDHNHLAL